jgi:hypothetical protein
MARIVPFKGATAPAPGLAPVRPAPRVAPAAPAPQPEAADQPDLRLIIEDAEEGGGVVYTIVDNRTGKVVSRLSREEVLRLRQTSDYAAGAVFSGKA